VGQVVLANSILVQNSLWPLKNPLGLILTEDPLRKSGPEC